MTAASNLESPPSEEALRAWLRLANVQLTARPAAALLAYFDNDPQAAFAASDAVLEDGPGLAARQIARLRDPAYAATDRQLDYLARYGVRLVLLHQPDYPAALREIPDPPPLLFVRGSLPPADSIGIGIVGSRHATPYGRAMSERFARELAGHGLVIVSGGAVGIDTAAHRGAVEAGGRTLALLGCGLDVDYPRENRALFERLIASDGALMTEYPLGAQPEAWRFPLRNRLISGLSQGVLVVEAPWQSGALITARCAAEHGRTVMAIPSNIDRPSGAGANELLKDGALLVTETEDVLRALHMIAVPARREHQRALELDEEPVPKAGARLAAGKPAPSAVKEPSPARNAEFNALPENRRKILECLSLTPRHVDAIAQATGITTVEAGVEMTLLELEGFVRRLPGNTYIRLD